MRTLRSARTAPVLAALLVAMAVPGCGRDLPVVPDTRHLGELTFRGGVDVAESFPVQLGFHLDIHNDAERELRLVSDGCGVLPRAYGSSHRTGTPSWDTRPDGVSSEPCLASPAPLSIPGGETVRLTRSYGARDILSDSLPDGAYYFTVTYRASLANSEQVRFIEVTAGNSELSVPR